MKITPTKSEDYSLLLNVFRRGLRNGLVSKADVVKWADGIILAEDEPDYFFIEIAIAPDLNSILEIMDNKTIQYDPVTERVLLGLLYHKMKENDIDPRKTASIMDEVNAMDVLSGEEEDNLYELSDDFDRKYGMEIFKGWEADTLHFLSDYREFILNNVTEWGDINSILEARIKIVEQEKQQQYERSIKKTQLEVKKQAAAIRIILALVVLFALFIVIKTYLQLQKHQYLTKFQHDLYSVCIWLVLLFVCYQMVKAIYKGMWKVVKK